jgi:two-component system chemotaxis response regulator CheB
MSTRDIITIGSSAGGVETLERLVAMFPADFPASVFIVQHTGPVGESWLPEILMRRGPLRASFPRDKEKIEPGHIYVAPKNCHLLVEPGVTRVVRGPHENRHRPAIDPLFRSAAWAYGPRVVGVVLTGYLDDGAAGLWAIKSCGGTTIVQAPWDAIHPDMPRNAAMASDVDHTLSLAEIGPLLVNLSHTHVNGRAPAPPESLKTEIEFAKMDRDITDMSQLGKLSPFTCPACRGALWELENGDLLRYRCHTGHAYSSDSLVGDQTNAIEEALYSALRAVEEKATALRRLRERHEGRPGTLAAEFDAKARELDQTAETLRVMLAGEEL